MSCISPGEGLATTVRLAISDSVTEYSSWENFTVIPADRHGEGREAGEGGGGEGREAGEGRGGREGGMRGGGGGG